VHDNYLGAQEKCSILIILEQYIQPKKKLKHRTPTIKVEGSAYGLVQEFGDDGTVLKL
jgi:hypothetical protein